MVLTGSINKQIVTGINAAGGRAVGLSGKDGNLVVARKLAMTKTDPATGERMAVDLGFVGEPEKVNPEVLHSDHEVGNHSGDRAHRRRAARARPSTSMPTRWRARWPAP